MDLRNGFTLGHWTVLPLESRLVSDAGSRSVRPKTMDVLLCLAEAAGDVVERDDLLERVWDGRAASDEPLTRCIGELRRAFGDTRAEPAYILTIPKRGYRLLEVPGPLADAGESAEPATPTATPGTFDAVRKPAVLLVTVAVLAGIAVYLLPQRMATDTGHVIAPAITDRSIAVLPFTDMSAEHNQEYMADGVAEEVLNLLTRIPGLRVISRSSTFSLKGGNIDVREVAERFGVGYVIEGSVRRSADRIRVTVQLIEGRSDSHIWSETYDREPEDIFAIQDDIARAVVSRLQLTFLDGAPASRHTDPEAYSLFLQGRYLHEQPAGDSMQRAFDYYEAALEVDPNYVPAWVWLAALYDDTVYSLDLPREEVGRRARDAIERALDIDPDDPLALGMSAVLTSAWDDDLAGAAELMQRAIDLDPGNPILLRWAAIVLTRLGRHDAAVRVMEYLFDRDPVGNITKVNLAATLMNDGRYADAVRICRIEVASTDATSPCGSQLIVAYVHSEDPESAMALLQRRNPSRVYTRLAPLVFYALGSQQEFQRSLAALQAAWEEGDTGLAYWMAYTFAYAGDADSMFEWLERALRDGVFGVTPNEQVFRRYEDDPRWSGLVDRAGMSPADLAAIPLDIPPLGP